jgi:hypothetical protein
MELPMGSGSLGHRPGARRASGASLKIAEKVADAGGESPSRRARALDGQLRLSGCQRAGQLVRLV